MVVAIAKEETDFLLSQKSIFKNKIPFVTGLIYRYYSVLQACVYKFVAFMLIRLVTTIICIDRNTISMS